MEGTISPAMKEMDEAVVAAAGTVEVAETVEMADMAGVWRMRTEVQMVEWIL